MEITVLIHLERVEDDRPSFVWWAEAPSLPGFSAAADRLPQLLDRIRAAVPDILADRGEQASDLVLRMRLAPIEAEVQPRGEVEQAEGHPLAGAGFDAILQLVA